MLEIRPLAPDEWLTLRELRLTALYDSPQTFLSTYEVEREFEDDHWRAEFDRGDWHVAFADGGPIGLLGATRDPDTPADACYLGYLWVAPDHRGRGIAPRMINDVVDQLSAAGMRTVFLWVLDGNDLAIRVYERAGFVRTNRREELAARPGRSEELLQLDLG